MVYFADQATGLGFKKPPRPGISFGKDDIVIPERKEEIVATTRALVEEYEQQYADGLITKGEKYNKVVDAWDKATHHVAEEMMNEISTRNDQRPRGRDQLDLDDGQLRGPRLSTTVGGMRGLMAKLRRDHRDSDHLELQGRPHGAGVLQLHARRPQGPGRHGAEDGQRYLTRRLVDVAQDCIIVEEDCGTTRGITLRAVAEGGDILVSLGQRILGRFTAEDVKEPGTNELVTPADTYLDEDQIEAIEAAGVQQVKVRLVLTCEGEGRRRATAVTWPAARRSTSARRSASSPPSRSASPAPS